MSEENFMHGLRASLHARCGEPDRKVADGVRTLSRLFTKQRDALGANYFADPALRRSYLLYFLPENAAKVASLLGEMPALPARPLRSEEHTSELQSRLHLVCRLLLEKKK